MMLIIAFFVIHAILLSVLVYQSRTNREIKIVFLSAILVSGAAALDFYKERLGAPIEGLPTKFLYVHHESTAENIYVWGSVEGVGNRLYVIPFSKEVAEKLEEAEEKSDGGQPQEATTSSAGGQRHAIGIELDNWRGDNTEVTK